MIRVCQTDFFDPHRFPKSQFPQDLAQFRRQAFRPVRRHDNRALQFDDEIGAGPQLRQDGWVVFQTWR